MGIPTVTYKRLWLSESFTEWNSYIHAYSNVFNACYVSWKRNSWNISIRSFVVRIDDDTTVESALFRVSLTLHVLDDYYTLVLVHCWASNLIKQCTQPLPFKLWSAFTSIKRTFVKTDLVCVSHSHFLCQENFVIQLKLTRLTSTTNCKTNLRQIIQAVCLQ